MEALACAVQRYAWGKLGRDSAVARVKEAGDASFVVSAAEPYAEIWMGTHPNGPATLVSSGESLYDYLQRPENASAVGSVPEGYPATDVPFMFKVLSIRTALSIQAHPDKTFAPILHARQPDIYKDPNHKPEMCVALTSLEAMKGFRPLSEIRSHLQQYPELYSLVGPEAAERFIALSSPPVSEEETAAAQEAREAKALESLFGAFLRCPADRAQTSVQSVVDRLRSSGGGGGGGESSYLTELILRLHDDYPGDTGIFGPLLLNCLQLTPGQAFFMQANEPHAYISGDIVEVMALSDNVVRAGLTPKFKDVETLCSMIEYRCVPDLSACLVAPILVDPFCTLYRPPASSCQEFEVELVTLPAGHGEPYVLQAHNCASILLFVSGARGQHWVQDSAASPQPLHDGAIYFLAAGKSLTIVAADAQVPICLYRAHINLGTS